MRMSKVSKGLAAIAVAAVVVGLAACGGSSSDPAKANFAGLQAKPQRPAPPLQLRDSLGQPVNIRDYRGKAVLITFIYTHCPDVCPLIVGKLHTTLAKLGAQAGKLKIVAVSTDPKGDTPATVRSFRKAHEMTGKMRYLIGSRRQLEHVWSDWHIVAKRDKK